MDGCRTEVQRMDLEHMLVPDYSDGREACAEHVWEPRDLTAPDLDLERCEQHVLSGLDPFCRHRFVQWLPLLE